MFPIKVTRLSQRTSQGQSGAKIQRDDRQSKPKKLVWEETELEMMTQSQPLTAWSINPKSARPPWRLHLCTFFVASSTGNSRWKPTNIKGELYTGGISSGMNRMKLCSMPTRQQLQRRLQLSIWRCSLAVANTIWFHFLMLCRLSCEHWSRKKHGC